MSKGIWGLLLGLTSAWVAVSADAAKDAQHAVERIERGNLVLEDVPPVPDEIADRTYRYQQARSAVLAGWLGRAEEGLLISTRFGDTAQVHRVAKPEGMRSQLTFFAEPVSSAVPAPDGRSFLFTKDSGGDEFYQIYNFDLASGDYRLVSDGRSRNTDVLWSNKGDVFAYSTTRRNGRDTDVVIGHLDGRPLQRVSQREGAWAPLDFSPDDRRLLLLHYISINQSELYIADLGKIDEEGLPQLTRFHETAEPVSFTNARFSRDGRGVYTVSDEASDFQRLRYEKLDGSAARVLTDKVEWDVEGLEISRRGTYLAYIVNADGISELRVMNLKTGKLVPVPKLPIGVVRGLSFDPKGRQLAFSLNSARSPTDVFSFEIGSKTLKRWTRSETGGLDASRFIEPELVHFDSFDGLRVPAFYYRGVGEGPRPVLIQIHGGPEAQALPTFSPLIEFYARELGVSVLVPNVRGSSGYGKRYLELDNGRQREDSVRDIGALLDWIAKQPELDARRVAVMGGSYGGYMTLASMTHFNDRLRGGIDIVGISNFVSFLTNTQDYRRDLRRAEYGDESDPEMRSFLESISPLTNAARITRPMFIVQGANDPRVPRSEAEQMVKTIRANNGGAVWYLMAKDEGHGFAKKANRDVYNNAVVMFLKQVLVDADQYEVLVEPAPAP
jgi:dipeptidyl aminopeptidase/acylaminoacyl peptidase